MECQTNNNYWGGTPEENLNCVFNKQKLKYLRTLLSIFGRPFFANRVEVVENGFANICGILNKEEYVLGIIGADSIELR